MGPLSIWEWLVDWPGGRWWPALAAILPACIPIARSLERHSPPIVQTSTVAGLLLAVAVLQVYGQARTERARDAAEARIDRIGSGVEALTAAGSEQAAAGSEQAARIRKLQAELERLGSDVRRIADGIAALAAEAEEAQGEDASG